MITAGSNHPCRGAHRITGVIDLTLTSRLSTRLIERIVVELQLGRGVTGASCTVSSGATWGFDPKARVRCASDRPSYFILLSKFAQLVIKMGDPKGTAGSVVFLERHLLLNVSDTSPLCIFRIFTAPNLSGRNQRLRGHFKYPSTSVITRFLV